MTMVQKKMLLEEEFRLLSQLDVLLCSERTILEQSDANKLNEVVAKKIPLIEAIECLQLQKSHCQTEPDDPAITERIQQNKALMLRCQDNNFINGCIINQTHCQLQQLTQKLFGQAPGLTYSKTGRNQSGNCGQSLAEV